MLDKQISVIFYLSSKWVVKQWRQLPMSTTHLVQELLMNIQYSGSSRSFGKEMRALKMNSIVASHQKLIITNWEQSSKLILLQLHGKLLKNSTSIFLWSFGIWSKLEGWKSLINDCLMSWLKKKIIVLKCRLLLFYATTMKHFSIKLWCMMKGGLYTTTSDNQLSGWTKKKLQSTSQNQTCTKKRHGHRLVVCCPYDSL